MLSTMILKAVRTALRGAGCASRLRSEENEVRASRLLIAHDEHDEGRNPEGSGGEGTGGEVLTDALSGREIESHEVVGGQRDEDQRPGDGDFVDDPRRDRFPGEDRPAPAG